MVWNVISPPRVSLCVWLVCLNRLPTKARLYKWGLIDEASCSLCHNSVETTDHPFCACLVVQPILSQILKIVNLYNASFVFSHNIHLLMSASGTGSSLFSIKVAMFCAVLDKIWALRNALVFKQEGIDVVEACNTLALM